MGAHLVSLVLAHWTHVSDRAFRVLVRMALTALDEPHNGQPAAVYFGGRDLLALTLRNKRGGNIQTAHRTAKRAVAELVAEGVIERASAGRSGQNAVYRLRLAAARRIDEPPVDNQSQGDTSGPPQGDTSGPVRGTPAGQLGGHQRAS